MFFDVQEHASMSSRTDTVSNTLVVVLVAIVVAFVWFQMHDSTEAYDRCLEHHHLATCNHLLGR